MRASVSVEGLGQHHDLTVAILRRSTDADALDWVRGHARTVVDVPYAADRRGAMSWMQSERGRRVAGHPLPLLTRYWPPSVGERIIEEVGSRFDIIVVMGTYVAGAALPVLDAGVAGILDAFDDDAGTNASLAKLDSSHAAEVQRYEAFQREVFPWFERVLFASLDDALPPFEHLPNAVHIPPTWSSRPRHGPLGLLFVGNAGYLPNRDALDRLRHRIVPAIEAHGIPVRFLYPGPDDDIEKFYVQAHVAAVPLRAAGGTRIKILEAFARGCPVVSTPTGARGLAVRPGRELIITADDDDDLAFARAVVDLARDDHRRRCLASAARQFVAAHHDLHDVAVRLAMLVGEQVDRGRRGWS